MPQVGEMSLRYLLCAHCLVVKLRPDHRQEDKDNVEEEERGQDDKGGVGELPWALDEVVEHYGANHGIVADVAQTERLAEPCRRHQLAEHQCGLTPEERLFPSGKDVVEVEEEAIELVCVRVPPGEQHHLCHHAHHHERLLRAPAVQLPQS